ncbi:MAG TPA: AraC family transcriptional regulator [Fibrobacteria bacterium]|nr:AraC family transcriptional regulator [Fibrobacteria bacterium]
MDILTDILASAGVRKSLLARHAFHGPWAMRMPCRKSMGFHLITHGEAWVRSPRFESPVRLERGDIILINRGFDHEVATDPAMPAPLQEGLVPSEGPAVPGQEPLAIVVCGVYQFQTEPIHPLFAELPDTIILRGMNIASHSPLHAAQQLLAAEVAQTGHGVESVVKALVDVMFHFILRDWMNGEGRDRASWTRVFRDPHLHRAIQAMHANLESDWSLEALAETAGLSRAAFAQRFKRLAGDTPAHYLARIRIQRAMDMLRSTEENLENIAERVGYRDPFVFSKAFKRLQGASPRDYRRSLRENPLPVFADVSD